MKAEKKLFLIILLIFSVLWASDSAQALAAETAAEDPDTASCTAEHYITGILNETALQSWREENYDTTQADLILDNLSSVLSTIVRGYVDHTDTKIPLDISLDSHGADFSVAGNYTVTVTILAPENYCFAEGVLREFTIPVQINDVSQPVIITSLLNQQIVDRQYLVPTDGAAEWEDSFNILKQYLSSRLCGYDSNGTEARLELVSFDTSALDLSVPGDYIITAELKASESNPFPVILSEDLQTLKIRVKVSRPADFELAIRSIFPDSVQFSYLADYYPQVQVYYLESDEALSEDDLSFSAFQPYPDEGAVFTSNGLFFISRETLVLNRNYYFCLYDGIQHSVIVHVINDGTSVSYAYTGGDRDGGDTDGNRPSNPPEEELPPSDPSEEPSEPSGSTESSASEPDTDPGKNSGKGSGSGDHDNAVSNGNNGSSETPGGSPDSVSYSESDIHSAVGAGSSEKADGDADSDNGEGFTVSQIQRLLESGSGSLRISEDGLLVIFPDNILSELSLEDSDLLNVRLQWISDTSFDLQLLINGSSIDHIPAVTLMVPYQPSAAESSADLLNESGETVSKGVCDPETGIWTFQIRETGTFTIQEQSAALPPETVTKSTGTDSSGLSQESADISFPTDIFLAVSASALLLTGSICLRLLKYRKGRKS